MLQNAPGITIAFEISESQACASKHTQPFLETVNGPAGLEAEALSARLLGRPTCHAFGKEHVCWTRSTAQRPSLHMSLAPSAPSHTDELLCICSTASLGWDGAAAGCFTICRAHTCCHFHCQWESQIPLPHFNLISGEGFVCFLNVPRLQLAGRAGSRPVTPAQHSTKGYERTSRF